MIEVIDYITALKSGALVRRLCTKKGVYMPDELIVETSELASDLVRRGFPLSDSLDGAINHLMFSNEPTD